MPSDHNRRTRTAGTPQGGAVGPPCRRPAQREKEFPHMSKRRGRHAARRPARRFVLLAIGLTLAAAAAVLIGGPFLRATPSAAHPDAAPVELDAQRSGSVDQVSRDHERSPSPSAAPASPSPSPSRPVAPVAGLTQAQMNNAAAIADVARRRNLPRQAAVVAVTTALQESDLHNLASEAVPASLAYPHEGTSVNYDSIGLFQQRPSQGWGTGAAGRPFTTASVRSPATTASSAAAQPAVRSPWTSAAGAGAGPSPALATATRAASPTAPPICNEVWVSADATP